MPRRPVIGVIGNARIPVDSPEEAFCLELGRGVVDRGWRLQSGGLGGVMEAASRGGRASARWTDGAIVGILPGWDPDDANDAVDVAIPTGLDHVRNVLVAQADAVVAVGGGAGTLSEMAFAWMFQRLLLARRGPGWAGRLADTRVDDRVRYPKIPEDRVFGVDTAAEALDLLERYLPRYGRRHTGLRRL